MIAPYLRDMASRRWYSKETLDTLSDPECENLNLELIATLLKHIHFEKPDGAILVSKNEFLVLFQKKPFFRTIC